MATIDWPVGRAFTPAGLRFGASTPKSAFTAFFTGGRQTIGHLADRLRCTVRLPACGPEDGQRREAFFMGLASSGDWVRLQHQHRSEPLGTLRGLPTVAASAAAGARMLQVSTTPGATLEPGDLLGLAGALVMARSLAIADSSGLLAVPLALPLVAAAIPGASLLWQAPTGTFQLAADDAAVDYGRGRWQAPLELTFMQVP